MKVLGHSQIGLTMNTYSHVAPPVLQAAADALASTHWNEADEDEGQEDGDDYGDDLDDDE